MRPVRGTLSLVFANVAAYAPFDRADPFASRCVDEDFNRLWTTEVLDGTARHARAARARVSCGRSTTHADFLLDLHSMSEPCPPLALAGRQRKGIELARAHRCPEHIVIDAGPCGGQAAARLRLLRRSGRSAQRAADRMRAALGAQRRAVAQQASLRFLRHFGMVDAAGSTRELDASGAAAAAGRSK